MSHFFLGPDALTNHISALYSSSYTAHSATCDLLRDQTVPYNEFLRSQKSPLTYPGQSGNIRGILEESSNDRRRTNPKT